MLVLLVLLVDSSSVSIILLDIILFDLLVIVADLRISQKSEAHHQSLRVTFGHITLRAVTARPCVHPPR